MEHPDADRSYAIARGGAGPFLAGGSIELLAQTASFATNRAVMRAGTPGVPPHRHRRSAEAFVILSGEVEALVGEEVVVLAAGDALVVEPGTVHALAPAAAGDAELLSITSPPAERFAYYELLDGIVRGEADPAELRASQERFDSWFEESAAWDEHRASATRSSSPARDSS